MVRMLTVQLIVAVGVDTSKKRLDSTAVRSTIRNLTRLGILVRANCKVVRELNRIHRKHYASVASDVIRK